MNRQQFSEFISNPGSVGPHSLKMLEELVKRYPYCQTGQILYAYNLLTEESLQYPLQIKKASAYAGDRRTLKRLVDTGRKVTQQTGIQKNSYESSLNHGLQPSTSLENSITELGTSAEKSNETIPLTIQPFEEFAGVDIYTGAVTQEELDTLPVLPLENEAVTEENPMVDNDLSPITASENGRQDLSDTAVPFDKDQVTPEELLFMVRKRLAIINAGKNSANSTRSKLSDLQNVGQQLSQQTLVEKFILEEPRITKPKIAFFNPSDSALRSNQDEEEIVSETLAQLYAKHGNISKAIHIYKELSLLNREKSRYFAAQIEKLSM